MITIAFVHGDNQYGYERAFALLKQEEFVVGNDPICRANVDIPLIHIGDNGDYYWGTELRDQRAWENLPEFYDEILMGNHEAAVLFGMELGGYSVPNKETIAIMQENWESGKLKIATSYDGFLITHAGIHPSFEDDIPEDPVKAAEFLNNLPTNHPIICSIGARRGGYQPCGGVLWRDITEAISNKWPQIHGHSRVENAHGYNSTIGGGNTNTQHYAIDVGYPKNGGIAGIYTHNCKIVEVNINA